MIELLNVTSSPNSNPTVWFKVADARYGIVVKRGDEVERVDRNGKPCRKLSVPWEQLIPLARRVVKEDSYRKIK